MAGKAKTAETGWAQVWQAMVAAQAAAREAETGAGLGAER